MSYTYTFLLDLNSINELKNYISEIISGLNSITYESRNVNLIFNNELSNEDKDILENAITNYTNPNEIVVNYNFIEQSNILNTSCSSLNYLIICLNNYNKEIHDFQNNSLKKVEISSFINNSDNYSLRVYDINNDIVLGELTNLNNTEQEIKTINIGNIISNTLIEIQCKVSSSTVNITGCFFIYGEI